MAKCDRVIFIVRCHGEPNDDLEDRIMQRIGDVVEYPALGWGILTIGRQYYHDKAGCCHGHPDPEDECNGG